MSEKIKKESKFQTLTSWSQACFEQLPEYSKSFLSGGTKVPEGPGLLQTPFSRENPTELLDALAAFKQKTEKSDLFQEAYWLDGGVPTFSDFAEYKTCFVQKLCVPAGSNVCFIGDLHGSIHSLLRNLNRLIEDGFLRDDFSLVAKNSYMIFLGDYSGRGRYGTEVWYTLLRLKLANWDNVFLLRGNHESKISNEERGFVCEVSGCFFPDKGQAQPFEGKFSPALKNGVDVYKQILDLYNVLPAALFLQSGDAVALCCHASIEPSYNPTNLLKSEKRFEVVGPFSLKEPVALDEVLVRVEREGEGVCVFEEDETPFVPGFAWDLLSSGNKGERKRVWLFWQGDVTYVEDYFKQYNLCVLFRGHQDGNFGFKMVVREGVNGEGLLHWKNVVSPNDQEKNDGFKIKSYVPIFTLSSAPEGASAPYDCYGMLMTAESFDDWRFKPCEVKI